MRTSILKDSLDLTNTQTALSVQRQVNAGPQLVRGSSSGAAPTLRTGDTATRVTASGDIQVRIGTSKGRSVIRTISPPGASTGYLAPQTGTVAPTVVTNFPNSGDAGWYRNTSSGAVYFVYNDGGTLRTITASTIGIAFTDISGAITDAQHGSRSGGTLHADASGSASGFLSTTFFTLLNNATSSATASTLVLRDGSADLFCARIRATTDLVVGGLSVVKTRQAAVADATGAGDVVAQLNALLDRIRNHGLIAP